MGYSSVPRFPQLEQSDNALTYPMLCGGSVVSTCVHRRARGWIIMLAASAGPPASEASGTVGGNDNDHLLC